LIVLLLHCVQTSIWPYTSLYNYGRVCAVVDSFPVCGWLICKSKIVVPKNTPSCPLGQRLYEVFGEGEKSVGSAVVINLPNDPTLGTYHDPPRSDKHTMGL
jgi:hypothetical protein